jgi:hypothetical protein
MEIVMKVTGSTIKPMAQVSTFTSMVQDIWENGIWTGNTDMAKKLGLMELLTKEILSSVKNKAQATLSGVMDPNT